ncbi:hypothetical protein HYR99_41835 [Candidatus Poribacteria bacterium]|nr:hypothetical protein [Candidatus Poribacteria bacterium]
MIDQTTQKPLCLSTDGNARPYLMVPVKQLNNTDLVGSAHPTVQGR